MADADAMLMGLLAAPLWGICLICGAILNCLCADLCAAYFCAVGVKLARGFVWLCLEFAGFADNDFVGKYILS